MKHVNLYKTKNTNKKKGKKDSRNGEVPFAMPLMCVQRRSHVERPWVGRTVTSMLLSTALL